MSNSAGIASVTPWYASLTLSDMTHGQARRYRLS